MSHLDDATPNDTSFEVRLDRDGHDIVAVLAGELDISGTAALAMAIHTILDEPLRPVSVAVDVTGLRFVDVAGTRALHAQMGRLKEHGCRSYLRGESQGLALVAELVGLTFEGMAGSST